MKFEGGLSFQSARAVVLASFKKAVSQSKGQISAPGSSYQLLTDTRVAVAALMLLAVIVFNQSEHWRVNSIVTIVVLITIQCISALSLNRYSKSASNQIFVEVEKILHNYDRYCQLESDTAVKLSHHFPQISAGHPHISMVTCYRNKYWQRIPSLLLAEGDLISLQGGDIAPGDCLEVLTRHSSHAEPLAPPSLVKRGTKILLSSSPSSSSSHSLPEAPKTSYKRHKSLAPDGRELLQLCGDVRCFRMAETPIESFVSTVIEQNVSSTCVPFEEFQLFPDHSCLHNLSNRKQKLSTIRRLFLHVCSKIRQILLVSVFVQVICSALKFIFIPESRQLWSTVCIIPLVSIILGLTPVSLPIFLMFVESLLTAKLLATTEAVLAGDGGKHSDNDTKLDDKKASVDISSAAARRMSGSGVAASSVDEYSDDEFLDEDIDERAEEIAVETSTRVLWSRVAEYFISVISHRFSLLSLRSLVSSTLLPVPLSTKRVLESLGAVTMVCFIDDDVICERFSVTEELFLLSNDDKVDKDTEDSPKGVVLDLHTNREAEGTRFEDPNWWKYLANLKPIGMNAMLTHTPMAPLESNPRESDAPSDVRAARAKHFSPDYESSLVGHVRRAMPLESLKQLAEEIGFEEEDATYFQRLLEMNVIAPGLGDARLLEDTHAWGQEESRRRGTLMTQVRSSIVLDSRSGGLQMMSHGDPALLLHYCSEYWDGMSISPFVTSNKKEVLDIYDRWQREDFDVVAFSYTPIPTSLQSFVLHAHKHSSGTHDVKQRKPQSNCVFIVDPFTVGSAPLPMPQSGPSAVVNEPELAAESQLVVQSEPNEQDPSCSGPTSARRFVKFADDLETGDSEANKNSLQDERSGELFDPDSSVIPAPFSLLNEMDDIDSDYVDSNLNYVEIDSDELLPRRASNASELFVDESNETCLLLDREREREIDGEREREMLRDEDGDINKLRGMDWNGVFGNGESVEAECSSAIVDSSDLGNCDSSILNVPLVNRPALNHPIVKSVSLDTAMDSFLQQTQSDMPPGGSVDDLILAKSKSVEHGESLKVAPRKSRVVTSASSSNKKLRSIGASLWPHMRQQVFLGIAASSVPVKPNVSDLREELTRAGVRFVYFSPRNMRRSKPVAEKIGIQFDWNCAISLRDLDASEELDPHRAISAYGDWDVHAKMPHGVESIKRHLREVDNVPLLVSLYTDSTADTIEQMVSVFQDYGEVVLSIGSSYRECNNRIFNSSDISVSVAMLPGDCGDVSVDMSRVVQVFPDKSHNSLTKSDLLLHFNLVGLGTSPLLQFPAQQSDLAPSDLFLGDEGVPLQLKLSSLLEGIRLGRVMLLNAIQALSLICLVSLSLSFSSVLANVLPVSTQPHITPNTVLMVWAIYCPILAVAVLVGPAPLAVMKNTPRKNLFSTRDENRFFLYLVLRCAYVVGSVCLIGWVSIGCVFASPDVPWFHRMHSYTIVSSSHPCDSEIFLVEDLMSAQLVLSLLTQASTLLERGQSFDRLPLPSTHFVFWACALSILSFHSIFLWARSAARGNNYSTCQYNNSFERSNHFRLHWLVWVLMCFLPVLGVFIGLLINSHDNKIYRRYLQFLRLEFDTRLGMHSPR